MLGEFGNHDSKEISFSCSSNRSRTVQALHSGGHYPVVRKPLLSRMTMDLKGCNWFQRMLSTCENWDCFVQWMKLELSSFHEKIVHTIILPSSICSLQTVKLDKNISELNFACKYVNQNYATKTGFVWPCDPLSLFSCPKGMTMCPQTGPD